MEQIGKANLLQRGLRARNVLPRKLSKQNAPCRCMTQSSDKHVLERGHPLDQIELLEDKSHLAPRFAERPAIQPIEAPLAIESDSPRIRRHQTGNNLEQGCLACTARAYQRHELACRNAEIQIVNNWLVAVALRKMFNLQDGLVARGKAAGCHIILRLIAALS
ncbi:hypothetical protein ACVJGD_006901 [Bradyrhizobium sp. USDA 10063]